MAIDDELLTKAKVYVAEHGTTLAALVEDSLRAALNRTEQAGKTSKPVKLPTVTGPGVLPGVNLDSYADLLDVMEGS